MFIVTIALALATALSLADPKLPNIVFILADDLNVDDQYDKSPEQFPNLKSLTDNGMDFKNAYVSLALCCPSRATLLTGRYAHNTGIYTNESPAGGFETVHRLDLEKLTVVTELQKAGYKTALFGKYLNGYPASAYPTYIPPGWSEWYAGQNDPYQQFNYVLNKNGRLYFYGSDPKDYAQDVLKDLAVDFIYRANDQPILLWMASFSPHQPARCAPKDEDAFPDIKAPRTPSFNDPFLGPATLWTNRLPLLSQKEIEHIDFLYGKRLRSMLAVDATIGALVTALSNTGKLNNTFIFLTSDNGFHLGEHGMTPSKNTGFEEDIRVPLRVRGPGIKKGSVSSALVLNTDIAKTFAEIAKINMPWADGRSLMPILTKKNVAWRKAFLLEHGDVKKIKLMPPAFVGIHTIDRVYIAYKDRPEREFYNLRKDPYQLDERSAKANALELNHYASWLEALKNCRGETCRALEDDHP